LNELERRFGKAAREIRSFFGILENRVHFVSLDVCRFVNSQMATPKGHGARYLENTALKASLNTLI
jgi:hypothetical protein